MWKWVRKNVKMKTITRRRKKQVQMGEETGKIKQGVGDKRMESLKERQGKCVTEYKTEKNR